MTTQQTIPPATAASAWRKSKLLPGLSLVLQYPAWTMPLCKFPAMARYSGKGDIKDGANWSCPANDKRLLTIGESGRQGGVIR